MLALGNPTELRSPMADSNPHTSPKTDTAPDDSPPPPHRFRIRAYVIPTLIGAVIGSVVLAPYCGISPDDPNGPSIAAGLGGFLGLFIGIVIYTLRITFTRKP